MRRSLALLTAAVTALLSAGFLVAPAAGAAESVPEGAWAGSALDPGPTTVDANAYRLSGTFRHRFNRSIEIRVSTSPKGSGPCAVSPAVLPSAATPRAFNVVLTIPCNGTYTIAATAVTTDNNAIVGPEAVALDRRISVAAPAPQVTGLTAEADGRSVTVSWDDMRGAAPDLDHYTVERRIDDGDYEEIAELAPDEQSFTDEDLPADGGEATYRVLSARPTPGGIVTSQSSEEAATPFDAAPTTTGPDGGSGPGSGGAGDGGGPSGTGGSGSGSGSVSGSDGGAAGAGRRSTPVMPPRVFSGTFLPPLLRPVTQTTAPPTTLDDGYRDALPYEQEAGTEEAGAEDPVLPDGAMASITAERGPGQGMVVPLATALVLAAWAFHLRLLARAARPTD